MLAVATGAYLAAVYLAGDGARAGEGDLAAPSGAARWARASARGRSPFAGLVVLRLDAGRCRRAALEWPALAAVVVSAFAGLVDARARAPLAVRGRPLRPSAAVAGDRRRLGARAAARAAPGLTVDEAAAGRPTLIATVVGVAIGAAILVPSLALLFGLVLRGRFDKEGREADVGVGVGVGEPSGRRSRISPFRVALFLVAAGVPLTLVFDGGPFLAAGVLALLTFVALASLSLGAAAAANDEPSESRR